MRIDLQIVPRLKGGWLGATWIPTRKHAVIQISAEKNPDLFTFGVTLFHEMLHVWTHVMKANGAVLDMRKEHKFIYAMHSSLAKNILLMRRK